jgi:hypothetical protein
MDGFMSVLPKKKQRAFSGLAGSPLAVITTPQPQRGRPRIHANAAARKRASRAEIARKAEEAASERDRLAQIDALVKSQKYDRKHDPLFLIDEADRAKGILITGGLTWSKIDEIDGAQVRDNMTPEDFQFGGGGSGRRKTAQGHGREADPNNSDEDEETEERETDKTFINKQKRQFKRKSKPLTQKALNHARPHFHCPLHSQVDGPCNGIRFESKGNGRGKPKTVWIENDGASFLSSGTWILLIQGKRKGGVWILRCGCSRRAKNIVTDPRTTVSNLIPVQ